MGYNYAYERARFEAEWKKKEEWYRSEGMSEEAIQEMRELDWDEFKGNRIYMLHNQEMPSDGILELMSRQSHGTYAAISEDQPEELLSGRYDWIECLDTPSLVRKIQKLSLEEKEILTMMLEGCTQTEIGKKLGYSQSNVAQKLERLKKNFKIFSRNFEKDL